MKTEGKDVTINEINSETEMSANDATKLSLSYVNSELDKNPGLEKMRKV